MDLNLTTEDILELIQVTRTLQDTVNRQNEAIANLTSVAKGQEKLIEAQDRRITLLEQRPHMVPGQWYGPLAPPNRVTD